MQGKTHSTEEIIRILRQADGGETALSVCREHNISEQTFYLETRTQKGATWSPKHARKREPPHPSISKYPTHIKY